MNYMLLMMGGSGIRFGSEVPKQYVEVDGRPVFSYILSAYDTNPDVDGIVIVSHCEWIDFVYDWIEKTKIKKVKSVVEGGNSRSESVLNGLKSLRNYAADDDVILIHDATHPYMDKKGIHDVIEAVKETGAATLAAHQFDTCYRISESDTVQNVIPREELVSGASPEGFRFGTIYKIYSESSLEELEKMTSAGAIALAHGMTMKVVSSNVLNLKITHPEDMNLFRKLVHSYFFEDL